MHPLIDSLQELSDNQIEQKIIELQRKYFSSPNVEVQNQIVMILDAYKEEARSRRQTQYQKSLQTSQEDGKDLDNLININ